MNSAGDAFFHVLMAAAVAYGIYQAAAPKRPPLTAMNLGRKWFSWMAMVVTIITLPEFFRSYSALSFDKWLVGLTFFGGLAFAVGWVYGRFFKFKAVEAQSGVPNASALSQALADIQWAWKYIIRPAPNASDPSQAIDEGTKGRARNWSLVTATILFVALAIVMVAGSVYTRENYASCLIDNMKGVGTNIAAMEVVRVCRQEHPKGMGEVAEGSGRGLFSFDSGAECTVKHTTDVRSEQAAKFIVSACNRLYNLPPFEFDRTTARPVLTPFAGQTDEEKESAGQEPTPVGNYFDRFDKPSTGRRETIYTGQTVEEMERAAPAALPPGMKVYKGEYTDEYGRKIPAIYESTQTISEPERKEAEKAIRVFADPPKKEAPKCEVKPVMTDEEKARCR